MYESSVWGHSYAFFYNPYYDDEYNTHQSVDLPISGTYLADGRSLVKFEKVPYSNEVFGRYKHLTGTTGTINGMLTNNVFNGTWRSGQFEGKIRLTFHEVEADRKKIMMFTGLYGYGNREPSIRWTGRKIGNVKQFDRLKRW